VFFLLVSFIFWLGGLSERGKTEEHGHAAPVIAGASDGDARARALPAPSIPGGGREERASGERRASEGAVEAPSE